MSTMNPGGSTDRRSRIRNVFRGRHETPTPVSIRLDLWFNHAVRTGALPAELLGMTIEQIEDMLGFCRSARYRARVHFRFPDGWQRDDTDGDNTSTVYSFPGGVQLIKRSVSLREHRQIGMVGHTTHYPISSEKECDSFAEAVEAATVAHGVAGFEEYSRAVGPDGMPMLILGSCPTSFAMLELMGYENFFYAMADYPASLKRLIAAIDAKFRAELWPEVMRSSAELILHGNHFSDDTTPPRVFRQYFVPYFRDFTAVAHAAGKLVVWHADAEMRTLLHDVVDAGFDGADCLATAPLVKQTLEECYRAWNGRIVCWGGLPSTVCSPEYPAPEFEDYICRLHDFVSGKPGFIIGVSDNMMPGVTWERVEAISRVFRA